MPLDDADTAQRRTRLAGRGKRLPGLPASHLLLAVAVATVWGTNFAVAKIGLSQFPPLFFALLRFTFVFFPAALVIRCPNVPLARLAAYGVLIGAQFGVLYIAMRNDISPGLASLAIQSQVFFTIALATLIDGERVRLTQAGALALAVAGLAIIADKGGGDASPVGLALVLAGGFSWACANMIAKGIPGADMLGFVVWTGLFALLPLAILSLLFEGPGAALRAVETAGAGAWATVAWQAFANTIFGYGVWSWLLTRHPASIVAPTSLLVPIAGMATSAVWLGEPLQSWKLAAAILVLAGLCLNLLAPRWPS